MVLCFRGFKCFFFEILCFCVSGVWCFVVLAECGEGKG